MLNKREGDKVLRKYKIVTLVIIVVLFMLLVNHKTTFERAVEVDKESIKKIQVKYHNKVYETCDEAQILEIYDYLNQFDYKKHKGNGFSCEDEVLLDIVFTKSNNRVLWLLGCGENMRIGENHYYTEGDRVDGEQIVTLMDTDKE